MLSQPNVKTKQRRKYVNLTPHTINYIGDDVGTIDPSGDVARVEEIEVRANIYMIDDIKDLPDPKRGVTYIVSKPVAMQCNRLDVVFPDELVRDENGRVIGCKAFGRYAVPGELE